MTDPISIRILEKDTNRRGDLFGRLMADLFVALGYEQPRLNIHKSGRELDLSADHRLEPRRAVGECKATAETTGGDELNKFVGVLDVEQEDKRPVTGYFISLAGFKETAIEQEKQRRRTKIVTLTGSQVIDELVKGRILIPKERAIELAGRCCAALQNLTLDQQVPLLAHERGWIWCICYTQGKARTHFALIHSDGTPLARALADEVIAADKDCGGGLEKLACLNPEPTPGSDMDPRVADALAAYGQYLASECGYIQLDGLPADGDVGSRRLRLENLFVPLYLDVPLLKKLEARKPELPATARIAGAAPTAEDPLGEREVLATIERRSIGRVLAEQPRLALLSAPGGGKSTLLKRLAIAYADPARREAVTDDLPQRDWLPIFLRCRELRGLARGSFSELIYGLSQRELVRQHDAVFRACVDRALLAGRVLLLVDGLDEIADPGDRAAFVCTLRTALQAYPRTAVVVTSREAGFRHVAAHLAPVCIQATVSHFDAEDIRRLSVAWHREVLGNTERVRTDAEQLAGTIVANDRIRRLAVNPLLLTTLLLVKRWVGSLPTRRVVLYGKAVEVLLMTWNVEGHEPIPEDEAIPQLCYVASSMMLSGVQKISRPGLAALIQQARHALPAELGYVKTTVDHFIHRVEDRSSLLMMTGHGVEDGRLIEFFEFRHLTFQEYLAARAMVEGWHPKRNENDTLVSVLELHFKDPKWSEVIPLAAVLGGKQTEALIRRLTQKLNELPDSGWLNYREDPSVLVPLRCMADEAPAKPETICEAVSGLVRFGGELFHSGYAAALARGRYGVVLREEAGKALLASSPDYVNSRYALMAAVWWQALQTDDAEGILSAVRQFITLLTSPERVARCEGALGCVGLIFHRIDKGDFAWAANAEALSQLCAALTAMLFSEHPAEQHTASWALGLFGVFLRRPPTAEPDILGRLFAIWLTNTADPISNTAAWAVAQQPLLPRINGACCSSVSLADFKKVLQNYGGLREDQQNNEKSATLVVAWYLRALSDADLVVRARALLPGTDKGARRSLRELLKFLGEELDQDE